MVDIAREAGVSLATVDRVLNGRDGVNAETASRVQAVVQRLNYAP
ncbi:MAG TPA: helix-turn-helix domain-containing protein, partial [Inquilinus sp.]